MSIDKDIITYAITDLDTGVIDTIDDCPASKKDFDCYACRWLGANVVHSTLRDNKVESFDLSSIKRAKRAVADTNALVSSSFPVGALNEGSPPLSCGDRRARVVETAVEIASRIVLEERASRIDTLLD